MRFEYKAIASDHKRPFIPIALCNPKTNKCVDCYALVDSGSERNLFIPILGELIGLDIENGLQRPIQGVVAGQNRSFFDHEIDIVVGDKKFRATVGFMPDLSAQAGQGVVGQNGFFDHFNYVKFDKVGNSIELGHLIG